MAPARRATANVDAPVWKSYLAVRVEQPVKTAAPVATATATARTRKRAKPSNVYAASSGDVATKQQLATRASVRSYWEALGLQERLQILMVDHPELVKQLYKLNLSLLCVGLMQRHLKAGTTRTVATVSTGEKAAGPAAVASTEPEASQATDTVSADPNPETPPVSLSPATSLTPAAAPSDSSERTYDLLEAMEFMDIGTGILTVKTELVEDVERMFSLVCIVLQGFLTSIHVLSDTQFHDLFVTESEVINTWEDYERLIAMLVEQLILRSYVVHLEKEATQQMEALLLEETGEVSRADTSGAKKKKKKKKKKSASKSAKSIVLQGGEVLGVETEEAQSESEGEPEEEDIAALKMEIEDFVCNSECSTEDADLSGPSSPVKVRGKSLPYVLNPNAQVFQPAPLGSLADEELKSPVSGKRKLDDFIIHIPWQDLDDEFDSDDAEAVALGHASDAEDLGCRRPREKQRRREEAELQWHLQHMYASTSSLYGWDFNQQREIAVLPPSEGWNDAALWRTDPRDVVRYYFPPPPPQQPPCGFASAAFPPGIVPPSSSVQPSRYYFTPPPGTTPPSGSSSASVYSPFLPPPGAPVSFWDENMTKKERAQYAELVEPPAFPKLQHYRSSPRPTKRR